MSTVEEAVHFPSGVETLLGIVSRPPAPADCGVLILVGGPQYRVGSHRQFVLLSRCLAENGYATMRFDFQGMGDSTGSPASFEESEQDIKAAMKAFLERCPEVRRVVLWGLCDAASAALLYWQRARDARVSGMCLLNPWVRSEATLARTQMKHYYGQRLLQKGFWLKLLRGQLSLVKSVRDYLQVRRASKNREQNNGAKGFQAQMGMALSSFPGALLVILSSDDYTAKEFIEHAGTEPSWGGLLDRPSVSRCVIEGADHTFSRKDWRDEVEKTTLGWLKCRERSVNHAK